MKIIDCVQGSEEWFEARRGVPTASRFGRILTAKTLKLSAQADALICELIGERFSLIPPEGVDVFTNRAMEWGVECEDEARRWYAMERNLDVQQVGFCLTDDGRFGCSPDGLVGADGILELKCPQAGTQVGYLLAGELPADYRAQCAGALIVTSRPWLDFLSYCPGLPPFLLRVVRDEYSEALAEALDAFHERYMDQLARIAKMAGSPIGRPTPAAPPPDPAEVVAPPPAPCTHEQRKRMVEEITRLDLDADEVDAALAGYGKSKVTELTAAEADALLASLRGRQS